MRFKSFLLGIGIAIFALAVSLRNIQGFPMMVGDEGIYVSQAWWLAHFRLLGPYTYWYDHFPLGWVQIGLWQLATGGPFAFGTSVVSGRIFMGLLKVFSALVMYAIAKKITKSGITGLFAAAVYTLSPLALTFNRLVLLDNVAVVWLLLHLWTVHLEKFKGKSAFLASLTLAVAILSKESLLFVLPVYLYFAFAYTKTLPHRGYIRLVIVVTLFFLLSFFPLLAILKKELVSSNGTVSFLEALKFQSTRGNHFAIWDTRSDFYQTLMVWLKIDPILILSGFGALIINFFFSGKNSEMKMIIFYTLAFSAFLLRGGLIYDFYIIPLIPLLVLNLAFAVNRLSELLKWSWIKIPIASAFCAALFMTDGYIFSTDATKNQVAATEYVRSNQTDQSTIVADNYSYLDLALDKSGTITNKHVFWYSKAETDPAIRQDILEDDPTHIDILEANDFIARKMTGGELPFLTKASQLLRENQQFGESSPPTAKPYTGEAVTVYHNGFNARGNTAVSPEEKINALFIVSIGGREVDDHLKSVLAASAPYGIMIGVQNIGNSAQFESFMNTVRSAKADQTILITWQSDTGRISIPWIGTALRSTYKSPLEARDATVTKTRQLKELGIRANVVTAADDTDHFLTDITDASLSEQVTPMLELVPGTPYTGSYPYLILTANRDFTPGRQGAEKYILELKFAPNTDFIKQKLSSGISKFYLDISMYEKLRGELVDAYRTDSGLRSLIDQE